MLVALIEFGVLLGSTLRYLELGTIGSHGGLHGHHDVVVLVGLYVGANGEAERLTTHGGTDHLNGEIGRALERRASTEFDDLGTSLGDVDLHLLPLLSGELSGADDISQFATGNLHVAAEDGHLLAVATVGSATGNLVLHHAELLGESTLQTSGVQTGKSGNLTGLQARIEQCYQTGEVSGVEDDDNVLYIWTEFLDVLSQFLGNLTVAGEQILTGHASLTGSTT